MWDGGWGLGAGYLQADVPFTFRSREQVESLYKFRRLASGG